MHYKVETNNAIFSMKIKNSTYQIVLKLMDISRTVFQVEHIAWQDKLVHKLGHRKTQKHITCVTWQDSTIFKCSIHD